MTITLFKWLRMYIIYRCCFIFLIFKVFREKVELIKSAKFNIHSYIIHWNLYTFFLLTLFFLYCNISKNRCLVCLNRVLDLQEAFYYMYNVCTFFLLFSIKTVFVTQRKEFPACHKVYVEVLPYNRYVISVNIPLNT